jgi:hypothetical protein
LASDDPLKKPAYDLQVKKFIQPYGASAPEMRTQISVLAAAALAANSRYGEKGFSHHPINTFTINTR